MYDGDDVIVEYNSNGTIAARYLHGQDIDEPILMTRGSNTYYYSFDGLGSVNGVIDNTQAIVESYKYDSFGNTTILDANNQTLNASAIANPYMFTGRRLDNETGLYYYRARYYDQGIGRFISQDPIGFEGGLNFYAYVDSVGKPISETNLYLYTGNNPVNRTDPLGLWYIDINVSVGYWGGGTGGITIGSEGIGGYLGGGFVTPGWGVSLTWSPQNQSQGWNIAGQWTTGIAYQKGYTFGKNGGKFWEIGGGWPKGLSFTGYYQWLWTWPWKRDEKKQCK